MKKYSLILVTILILLPVISRMINLPKTSLDQEKTIARGDPEFNFQKDVITSKGVLFFQATQKNLQSTNQKFSFHFKDELHLKLPPVIHTDQKTTPQYELQILINSSERKINQPLSILCHYSPNLKKKYYQFEYSHCELSKKTTHISEIIQKDIFKGKTSRQLSVMGGDILSVFLSEASSIKKEQISNTMKIEAIFEVTIL